MDRGLVADHQHQDGGPGGEVGLVVDRPAQVHRELVLADRRRRQEGQRGRAREERLPVVEHDHAGGAIRQQRLHSEGPREVVAIDRRTGQGQTGAEGVVQRVPPGRERKAWRAAGSGIRRPTLSSCPDPTSL